MQRLTSRNPDNSISVDRVSGQELLQHLAEYEDQLEQIEQALVYLEKCSKDAFYKRKETYFAGKYTAFHKAIEAIKRAREGKPYGH